MALHVYTSNRLELLVSALAETVAGAADPFRTEIIVVQSAGMQRWLAMELARRFGVWANCRYPFPNLLVGELCSRVLGGVPAVSPFDPALLRWRIMALLPDCLAQPAFAELHGYLAGENRELKLYQLSGRIADVFDQYTLFRADLPAGWEAGRERHWQAVLWRLLVAETGALHRAALKERFLRAAAAGLPADLLPPRLAVFGVSYLPGFHLEFLRAIAPTCQVNLFLMSPCREYWSDILPARALARCTPAERDRRIEGNPLLASFGRLGRDFSELIIESSAAAGGTEDLYRPAPGTTLLQLVQNDILDLTGADDGDREQYPVAAADRSLRVHSCHSPLREVEVLHDTLLELFATLPGLTPGEILVMTPDMETYAPYISAVFEGSGDGSSRIPYSLADRTVRREGRLAEGLLALFALPGSRLPVTRVLDLLSLPPVAAAFGFQAADLDQVRSWLEELRICWGMDEAERQRHGFPPYRQNSWRAGLDRLLLGYAMPGDGVLFAGILPFDAMEGDKPRLAGQLVCFMETLDELVDRLDRERTLAQWEELCREMVGRFFAEAEEDAAERAILTMLLDDLRAMAERAGHDRPVGLAVFRSWLEEALDRQQRGLGFMTGGVTFCALLPMRSIPFRVIVLLGMNDGVFPRQNRPVGFDLVAREPRRGDRSLRDEDRYLFLEALLSARDCFLVSYTGQSIRDNGTMPPSVVLDELLEYLGRRFGDGTADFPARLVTRHRLQPFSPSYFTGGGPLRSYSQENFRAVRARRAGLQPEPLFMAEPLPAPGEEWRQVSVAQLLAFYDHPVRFLLRNRIGIRLDEVAPPLADREPFALDGRDAYRLRQRLLEQLLDGRDGDELLAVARAEGVLPPARQGELLFRNLQQEVTAFAAGLRPLTGDRPALAPRPVDCTIGDFRVSGLLTGIWPDTLLRYRCAKRSGRDLFRLWIEHLLLNLDECPDYPRSSTLVMTDGVVRLRPTAQGGELLGRLLDCYWQGLQLPLQFFPRSSVAYARRGDLGAARTAWFGPPLAEGDDPYYQLCFGSRDPLDDEFQRLARLLLTPLLDASAVPE